jgi:DNA-binding XRE family transcriptional regulator
MAETLTTRDRDLRAGRFVSALRSAKGLSPEQMDPMCGVSASTIRDIEKKGVIPHLQTQDRLAAFFGIEKEAIWKRPRRTNKGSRSASQRTLAALEAACGDPTALSVAETAVDPFAFGVAWAVIRAQNPYAPSQAVSDRALLAVEEWHGAAGLARVGP